MKFKLNDKIDYTNRFIPEVVGMLELILVNNRPILKDLNNNLKIYNKTLTLYSDENYPYDFPVTRIEVLHNLYGTLYYDLASDDDYHFPGNYYLTTKMDMYGKISIMLVEEHHIDNYFNYVL